MVDYIGLDKDARDEKLIEDLHLNPGDLQVIRMYGSVIDRVLEAAEILKLRLKEHNVDTSIIPAQFTSQTLGWLIDDGMLCVDPVKSVSTALKRRYRVQRDEVVEEFGLRPTYTQLLRQEIDVSRIDHLCAAKRAWPGLEVSDDDWLKDIRIPVNIGRREATLIGICLGYGNILSNPDSKHGQRYRIELWGTSSDFGLFQDILDPLFRTVHNDNLIIIDTDNNGTYDQMIPGRVISSKVVITWLVEHLNFSLNRTLRRVPRALSTQIQYAGFFSGIVATKAGLYSVNKPDDDGPVRWRMYIYDDDHTYVSGIKSVATALGYSPTERTRDSDFLLDFGKEDIVDMIRHGIFMHPDHIKKVLPLVREIAEPHQPIIRDRTEEDYRLLAFMYNCGVSLTEIGNHFGISVDNSYHVRMAERLGYKILWREKRVIPYQRSLDDVLQQYKAYTEDSTMGSSETEHHIKGDSDTGSSVRLEELVLPSSNELRNSALLGCSIASGLQGLHTTEQKKGFMSGLIAASAIVLFHQGKKVTDYSCEIRVKSSNAYYTNLVLELARDLGYSPNLESPNLESDVASDGTVGNVLVFNTADVTTMLRQGLIINREHIKATKQLFDKFTGYCEPDGPLSRADYQLITFMYNFGVPWLDIINHFSIRIPDSNECLKKAESLGYKVYWREKGRLRRCHRREADEVLQLYNNAFPSQSSS